MNNEPALIMGLVTAAIDLVVAFGLPLAVDQRTAIVGVVSAVLALIGAFVVRQSVTPIPGSVRRRSR